MGTIDLGLLEAMTTATGVDTIKDSIIQWLPTATSATECKTWFKGLESMKGSFLLKITGSEGEDLLTTSLKLVGNILDSQVPSEKAMRMSKWPEEVSKHLASSRRTPGPDGKELVGAAAVEHIVAEMWSHREAPGCNLHEDTLDDIAPFRFLMASDTIEKVVSLKAPCTLR